MGVEMVMLSSQEEQAERKRVLANDARVREQAGTFMSHTHSEIGGRYAGVGAQMVVGADPIPKYPAAAAHQHDPCGLEPPLGYRIDAMPEHEPPEPFPLSQAQGNSGDLTAQQGISPRDLSSPPFRRMK